MAIVLRTIKGLPLTYAELDNNFSELEDRIADISGSNVASINGKSGNVYITTTDINEGTNLYYTDLRVDTRVATKTSDFFAEGSINLYYSNARVDARIASKTTDNLAEGLTNKYFTTARAREAVSSAGSPLSYDSATGVFTMAALNTTNVSEGVNLYFTNARVDARLAASSIDALADVDTISTTPSDNNVLTWNNTFSKWIPAPVNFTGAGLGEVNTANNVGTGQGIYATKVGFDLRFYTLAGSNGISLSAPAANVITLSNAQDISTTASVTFANANITTEVTTSTIKTNSGNITLTPAGGSVIIGPGSAPATLSSSGTYNIKLNTNNGTNSGEIAIVAGVNGNINLTPDGTGQVVSSGIVNATRFVSNIANGTAPLVVTSTTQVANLNVAASGTSVTVTSAAQPNITSVGNLTIANIDNIQINDNTISSTDTNGNINLTPNGTGNVILNTATATRLFYAGTNKEIITSSNLTFSGTVLAVTGNVTATNASATNFTASSNVNAATVNATLTNVSSILNIGNLRLQNNHIEALNTNGNINLNPVGTGRVYVSGWGVTTTTLTSSGATILGTTSADTLTINASLVASLIPQTSNNIDLGSPTYKFRHGFFTANLYVDTLVTSPTFTSNVATGTAPFAVSSTTQVANLNVATSGSVINGTSNITIAPSANVNISSAGTANVVAVSAAGATVTGNVNVSNRVTAPGFTSNVATGTAPFVVTSTTQVANLNVATAGTAISVVNTVTGTNSAELVRGNMADNDQARILVGATASDAGYLEIATADNGTEPIYVRQYTGTFTSLTRTLTLLDGSGNTYVPGNIIPLVNGTQDLGTTSLRYGTLWGLATSAQYADLAERYQADNIYEPGTVLIFGGDKEVTTTDTMADVSVAGVVSTNPAYLMNDTTESNEYDLPVALRGKVPVKVVGSVNKGDLLVTSSTKGYAMSVGKSDKGAAVFAKAIENKKSFEAGVVWAVII